MTTDVSVAPPASDSRLDEALIALGSGLVWAAILISSIKTRGQGDIDWSNYLMGIAGTLGLLGVAAVGYLYVTDQVLRSNLMAWPGAFAALGAGLMIGVAMDDNDATLYAVGLVIAAISGAGYYAIRRGSFLVTGLVGLALLYGQLFDDVIGFDDIEGDNFAMTIAGVVAFYTVAVTAAGWFLPETRDLTGVLAGAVSVIGFALTMIALAVVGFVMTFIGGFAGAFDDSAGGGFKRDDTFDNDVWVILVVALLLCLGWAWCSWQTGHMGYRILIVTMLSIVVPASVFVLAVKHPTWWELLAGLGGAVALGAVAVRALGGLGAVNSKVRRG